MRRALLGLAIVAALGLGVALGAGLGGLVATGTGPPAAGASPTASVGTAGFAGPGSPPPPASPLPATPRPRPSPAPTPVLVPAPLTGRLVPPEAARRHPIAVMVDDLGPARPQAGFSDASVVWHAPAEGGIPRYMLVFGERVPGLVGPVRSARHYFIAWAAETRAVYVHVGGSPQALATLRRDGRGELVYDADAFRWEGTFLWRDHSRPAPHNVYTDGEHLRRLAARIGATDGPLEPAWRFGSDLPLQLRPEGGRIELAYPANRIRYRYDRATNRYVRSVTGESPQRDAASGEVVAPANVVVLVVRFGPLHDGHPEKKRLEADVVGDGVAYVATNGRTIVGRWRKESLTGPTRLLHAAGEPVRLTVGQTFVQVVPVGTRVTVADGAPVEREPGPWLAHVAE